MNFSSELVREIALNVVAVHLCALCEPDFKELIVER